ncbi:DUF4097 family beta strand repeat protein [candidate division KSB1 bacterium]|nr:DUF4097 family beta strand repeat protein [candidate division KSB1 bacterium]
MTRYGKLIALVLMGLIPGLGHPQDTLYYDGRYYVGQATRSFAVTEGGKLVMTSIVADIKVEAWSQNQVQIIEVKSIDVPTKTEARTAWQKTESSFRQEGNLIEVEGRDYKRKYIRGFYRVKVPVVFSFHVDTEGGDISVNGLSGEVVLNTSGGDIELKGLSGRVEARTSGGDMNAEQIRGKLTLKTSGGDLVMKELEGIITARTSGGDVELIHLKGDAELKTSGGDIYLGDIEGESVTAHTSGGDIEVQGVKSNLKVTTFAGDVDIENTEGEVIATTSGGDVEIIDVVGGVKTSTSGGDIKCNRISGFVEAKTSGGDIVVKKLLNTNIQDHHLDLETSGGNIELYLPPNIKADVEAKITIRPYAIREYHITSDFPLEIEKIKEGGYLHITGKGKINGGGHPVNLKTTRGNIYIKELED